MSERPLAKGTLTLTLPQHTPAKAARSGPVPQFQVGGTIREGSLYVVRAADAELSQALRSGEFCYVLAPRQIGKSSLRLRTKRHLEAQGIRCVSLDLTQFGGRQATSSEWYFDLTYEVGKQLGLPDATTYWQRQSELSPLYRWLRYLRDLVLDHLAGPVVVFIDELDALLAVPGVARDDFFAAIRALYNARADDAAYARLTFCLFGVAMPGDLVQDELRTPFNIGRCITLPDFSRTELCALHPGLVGLRIDADQLLDQIFHWTCGHPYMTQKLCAALCARGDELRDPVADVRGEVERLFLRRGRVLETNLANAEKCFAREIGSPRIAQMLWLYGRLCGQERVPVSGQDPCQMALRLTGMAAERHDEHGEFLTVRNLIFAQVFDARWVKQQQTERLFLDSLLAWRESAYHADFLLRGEALTKAQDWARGRDDITPDERHFLMDSLRRAQQEAEQRQREQAARQAAQVQALRREQLEALSRTRRQIIIVLWAAIGLLLTALLVLRHQYELTKQAKEDAERMHKAAARARDQAEWLRAQSERAAAQVATAYSREAQAKKLAEQREQQALSSMRKGAQLAQLADRQRQRAEQEAAQAESERLRAEKERRDAEAARELAQTASQQAARLQKEAEQLAKERYLAQQELLGKNLELEGVQAALLAAGRQSKSQALLGGMRAVAAALKSSHPLTPNILRGLIAATATLQHPLIGHNAPVRAAGFSADGKLVLTAGDDGVGRVWDATTGALRARLVSALWFIDLLALSPDGTRLATVGEPSKDNEGGTVKLWQFDPQRFHLRSLATLRGHKDLVRSLQFSPDGSRLLTASDDGTARIFAVRSARLAATLTGHQGAVLGAAFSPDGTKVATIGSDQTARIYDAASGAFLHQLGSYPFAAHAIAFSPGDGSVAIGLFTGEVYIYSTRLGTLPRRIAGSESPIEALVYSPDGRRLFTAGADGALKAYDALSGQFLFPVLGHRGAVVSVALSPDGTRLVSASEDGTARISFTTIEGFFDAGCGYLERLAAAQPEHASPVPERAALLRDCAELARLRPGEFHSGRVQDSTTQQRRSGTSG